LGFFRRERPIHEQLADEAGLDIDGTGDELALTPADDHAESVDVEYDELFLVEVPQLPGDVVEFVALADGTLITEEEAPDGVPGLFADAITLRPPYHAFAMRTEGDVWRVSVRRVAVVSVPEEVPGDEVEMVVNEEGRGLWIDDAESDVEIPSLERFGAERFEAFDLRASRLDETLWEVTVLPL
jgi:hypothetical protein